VSAERSAGVGDALIDRIRALGVIPVVVIDDPADAEPLADALAEGGLPCAEITFRTDAAAEALRRIAARLPDLLLGAGTVLSPAQADAAIDAGARFVVSPGFDADTAARCVERGVPVFPGVVTPTDVQAALRHGHRVLKFFPAGAAGGPDYLNALAGPFPDVRFIPTGGIGPDTLASYLALPRVLACGGSWLAPRSWVREGRFDRVRRGAAEAVEQVRRIRAASP
jgi:2-dehydro-3-deoxyphosphogluconate aldolase/(4S)-4-hydroxy-2-oxoglutarate aldolase